MPEQVDNIPVTEAVQEQPPQNDIAGKDKVNNFIETNVSEIISDTCSMKAKILTENQNVLTNTDLETCNLNNSTADIQLAAPEILSDDFRSPVEMQEKEAPLDSSNESEKSSAPNLSCLITDPEVSSDASCIFNSSELPSVEDVEINENANTISSSNSDDPTSSLNNSSINTSSSLDNNETSFIETETSAVQVEQHHDDKCDSPVIKVELTNGESYVEDEEKIEEPKAVDQNGKAKILNGTIASELKTEDYKLPEVVEVKKHFEFIEQVAQNDVPAPPKKGALVTNLDSTNIKTAYEDVRRDGSDTQWAVFKYEGPKIVTSATGINFEQFKNQFAEDERAFGYIRVQTGDEMSKRAKFLLITWVGSSVSVLKRAKMSTDKALIKNVVSNFAVELQTENIADIDLQNFETELHKAGGAHYGTGVRG